MSVLSQADLRSVTVIWVPHPDSLVLQSGASLGHCDFSSYSLLSKEPLTLWAEGTGGLDVGPVAHLLLETSSATTGPPGSPWLGWSVPMEKLRPALEAMHWPLGRSVKCQGISALPRIPGARLWLAKEKWLWVVDRACTSVWMEERSVQI